MNAEDSLEQRARYRDLMNRLMGVGVAGGIVATVAAVFAPAGFADAFLFAGVGVYYLGVLGYAVVWYRTGVRLFDEREARIERRTGQILMLLVTFVGIFGIPADVLLDVTGAVAVPTAVRGAIWGYGFLLVVSLLVYGYVDEQHS